MRPLSQHERLILGVLEEAGEEHISALANTIEKRLAEPLPNIIHTLSAALVHLINCDLARVATLRDPTHRRLVPLPKDQSISIVTSLDSLLDRSVADELWHWKGAGPIADVILTDSGLAAAHEVLMVDGWPSQHN